MAAWRRTETGIDLRLRVTPNAGRDTILGVEQRDETSVLRVKVAAPPDKGRANKAVIALLAKALNVPKSSIRIASGAAARDMIVHIEGAPKRLIAA
ncbi:MAG: DUF167 family protein, partial [Cucumibacter sp.]